MLKVECDNPELTKELARLAADVTKAGAWFHDSLVLKALNGNFYFCSALPAESREVLISIPEEVFVSYDGQTFSLEGDKIKITGGLEALDLKTRERLETIVRIYNLTNKIEKYKNEVPRAVFKDDPEMLKKLVAARPNTGPAKNTMEILNGDQEQVIVSSFLKTRNFKFGGAAKRIIPFIDFVNHHPKAMPFDRAKTPEGKLTMALRNCKPVEGENQCFARYGKWDSHDTYLMFGFSSENPSFVRSVPVDIDIEGAGKLRVKGKMGGRYQGPLPKEWADLQGAFPQIKIHSRQDIEVSSLLIPSIEWPLSLKRILVFLLMQMMPGAPESVIQEKMALAEFQVLFKTLEHYQNLLKFFEGKKDQYRETPAFREAVKMAKIQIHEIEQYQRYSEELGKEYKKTAGSA